MAIGDEPRPHGQTGDFNRGTFSLAGRQGVSPCPTFGFRWLAIRASGAGWQGTSAGPTSASPG